MFLPESRQDQVIGFVDRVDFIEAKAGENLESLGMGAIDD
jgi:hypothetical protein